MIFPHAITKSQLFTVRVDESVDLQEAAYVTIHLYKQARPERLDGDFLRYMMKLWDEYSAAQRSSEPK